MLHIFLVFFIINGVSYSKTILKNPILQKKGLAPYFEKIQEPLALQSLEKVESSLLTLPSFVSDSLVECTFTKFESKDKSSSKQPPIVLVHGFDSSSIEFRRIAPILSSKHDVYCLDILGWGFSEAKGIKEFSPEAKVEHLKSFVNQVVCEKCVIGGASLGGAIAIHAVTQAPELFKKLVLIDAQAFIDGDGPKDDLPDLLAKIGILILKSAPLRMFANYIAYSDKSFATWDAMLCGRIHCEINNGDDWIDASIQFLKSGGFITSNLVKEISLPSLVLWGNEDQILEVETTDRFREELKGGVIKIVGKSGHVPHLEQPQISADLIMDFIGS